MSQRDFFTEYMSRTGDAAVTKWLHYFDIYTRELEMRRASPLKFLEIGVFRGGSIPMWKEYFAPHSTLVFIDIDPSCKAHEIEGTNVRIGSQADPAFLDEVAAEFGPFDVVLDDGSHINAHQIASFNALWPHLAEDGLYLVEDCHTSYWPGFGGGYRNPQSFMSFAKGLIDVTHSWYTDEDEVFPFDPRAKEIHSTRFYDSVIAIEKCPPKEPPTSLVSRNGQITRSRKGLEVRGRRSVFAGKDGV
jgi:hypothetical protein